MKYSRGEFIARITNPSDPCYGNETKLRKELCIPHATWAHWKNKTTFMEELRYALSYVQGERNAKLADFIKYGLVKNMETLDHLSVDTDLNPMERISAASKSAVIKGDFYKMYIKEEKVNSDLPVVNIVSMNKKPPEEEIIEGEIENGEEIKRITS